MATIAQELIPIKESLQLCFNRPETKETALAYFKGLISATERKNSWQLAEQSGYENPYAFQYLLGRATWDAEQLRDISRSLTLSCLGYEEGVLSIDETGFLKKGKKSAGVGRQYSGTAGRIENCQIGVFLSYATKHGRALVDRELYIPQDWFEEKSRCSEAGIPESVTFKTKPELALKMLERTLENNIRPAWVVGDTVYGCHSLRAWLEKMQQPYVLAIASSYPIHIGMAQHKAKDLWQEIRPEEWQIISAGEGTKGQRYYGWYRMRINSDNPEGWERYFIIRKNIKNPDDVAFYIAFAPTTTSLKAMVEAAGSRWTIEECFEMAKGEVGLDQYEVRSWKGWYRHITFSMFALSFLVKLRLQLNQDELQLSEKKTVSQSMIPFRKSRGLA